MRYDVKHLCHKNLSGGEERERERDSRRVGTEWVRGEVNKNQNMNRKR